MAARRSSTDSSASTDFPERSPNSKRFFREGRAGQWTDALDPTDPLHDRLLLESLWIHQAHGRIDTAPLERLLEGKTPEARAGAVRVLRHWIVAGDVDASEAIALLQRAVVDEEDRPAVEVEQPPEVVADRHRVFRVRHHLDVESRQPARAFSETVRKCRIDFIRRRKCDQWRM